MVCRKRERTDDKPSEYSQEAVETPSFDHWVLWMNAEEEPNQKMIHQIDEKQLICLLAYEFQRFPARVVIPFRFLHALEDG